MFFCFGTPGVAPNWCSKSVNVLSLSSVFSIRFEVQVLAQLLQKIGKYLIEWSGT